MMEEMKERSIRRHGPPPPDNSDKIFVRRCFAFHSQIRQTCLSFASCTALMPVPQNETHDKQAC